MTAPRHDEIWAELCIELATGADVRHHDDQTAASMFDLAVFNEGGQLIGAIEVTTVMDERWQASVSALLAGGEGGRTNVPGLANAWAVEITAAANQRAVRDELASHLRDLETLGISTARLEDWSLGYHHPQVVDRMRRLGINDSMRYGGEPGNVFLDVDSSSGGAVNSAGAGFVDWLFAELSSDRRARDVAKVDQGLPIQEIFLLARHGLPWEISSYLEWWTMGEASLPPEPARLPASLTGVWVVSTWADAGLHWDGRAWSFFTARSPEIASAMG
jgi:hypothetical protein